MVSEFDVGIPIVGMGWTTPLGDGIDPVWERLLDGETGIRDVASDHDLRTLKAAPAPAVEDESDPGKRFRRLAIDAGRAALRDAGLDPRDQHVGLVLGTSLGERLDDATVFERGLHGWAEDVGDVLGSPRELVVSLSTACSSGSDTISVAAQLLRSGLADLCLCGGVDIVTKAKRVAHSSLGTLASDMVRPFDREREGTLLGEGAALLALARPGLLPEGRVEARLLGAGASNDAEGLTRPDPDGEAALKAVRRSLASAGVRPGAVDVVNAHGSGTPTNDGTESAVYTKVFGSEDPPVVFATKGAFGHTLGATGSIEAIATIKALQEGLVPPVAGLREPIDAPFAIPVDEPTAVEATTGLSLTLGFGGYDTSLVFEVAG